MTRATRGGEYSGQTERILHVSFELGIKDWKLGFTTDLGAKPRLRTMPAGDLGRLEREIAEGKRCFDLTPAARVRSCYEAGRDGFWLHRYLVSRGIENAVVESSSIEVNRRQRRAKSDGLDARKLVTMLVRYHAGERKVWSVVRVPTVEEEDRRQLHRELRTLKKERTRTTNRIKGLLANQGIRLEKNGDLRQRLGRLRQGDGAPLPAGLLARPQRGGGHAGVLHGEIFGLGGGGRQASLGGGGPGDEEGGQVVVVEAGGRGGERG